MRNGRFSIDRIINRLPLTNDMLRNGSRIPKDQGGIRFLHRSFGKGLRESCHRHGRFGNQQQPSFTAHGDIVKMAGRLAWKNREYDSNIIVPSSVEKLVNDQFSLHFLDQMPLKGENELMDLFKLKNLGSI